MAKKYNLYTIAEAAEEAGMTYVGIKRAIARGDIKAGQTEGGTILIEGKALRHYLNNRPKLGRPKLEERG